MKRTRIGKVVTFLRKRKDTYGEQIFFCKNWIGDKTERIYDKDGISIDYLQRCYYEIFDTLYEERETLRTKLGEIFRIDTEYGVDETVNFPKRCTNYTAVTVRDLKEILKKHEDWEMLICREGELDIMSGEITDIPIGSTGDKTFPACKWLGYKAKIAIRNTGVSLTEMWANKKRCEETE